MSQAPRASTNINTITKNPKTGRETMQHHPYTSEITFPASGKVEKTKQD